ncbi:hypothetical protein [Qaidamihabitans albus]|uniref:hypothetical protein n=1 Tax=Qaidamihabitans albus TaxID=2795733 RepID=UPI001F1F8CBF|nr:hypothetical protein [Qaidamihabitans albus]
MSRFGRSAVTAVTAAVTAALVGGSLAAPAGAQAQEPVSTAGASLGAVDIVVAGTPARAEPIAQCDVEGPTENSSRGSGAGRHTSYGSGDTTCARDADGVSTAKASGRRFETEVLRQFGGPVLRVRNFSAECRTTGNGSSGYVELSGVSGFRLPSEIPPEHTITIPGRAEGDPPMAELVLNELVAPTPPDGSLTTHALHIKLFPQGGPGGGDIFVGTATCDPYAA